MFKSAKVGDRVWSMDKGWGTVKDIFASKKYPLTATFKNNFICAYTLDGKNHTDDLNPTLFWDKVEFEVPSKPKQRVEKWISFFIYNGRLCVDGFGMEPILFDSMKAAIDEAEGKPEVRFLNKIAYEI